MYYINLMNLLNNIKYRITKREEGLFPLGMKNTLNSSLLEWNLYLTVCTKNDLIVTIQVEVENGWACNTVKMIGLGKNSHIFKATRINIARKNVIQTSLCHSFQMHDWKSSEGLGEVKPFPASVYEGFKLRKDNFLEFQSFLSRLLSYLQHPTVFHFSATL